MLKKDHDRLKKHAKKQQALQQSMLDIAMANINKPLASEVSVVQPALKYPGFSCPFVWGTALLVLLAIVVI
jgi:hypothetical protein